MRPPQIALKAFADHEWSDDLIAAAVVDVTPSLLDQIAPIARAARRLDTRWQGQLLSIEVLNGAATWYGDDLVSACELADATFSHGFHEQSWAQVPIGLNHNTFELQPTELERVACGSSAGQPLVCWRCRPKRGGAELETASIVWRELKALARRGVPSR